MRKSRDWDGYATNCTQPSRQPTTGKRRGSKSTGDLPTSNDVLQGTSLAQAIPALCGSSSPLMVEWSKHSQIRNMGFLGYGYRSCLKPGTWTQLKIHPCHSQKMLQIGSTTPPILVCQCIRERPQHLHLSPCSSPIRENLPS